MKKPRRGAEGKGALLPDKYVWVLDTIKRVLGKRFSAQGKHFKRDARALARRCRDHANKTGETRRGVLKRVCREVKSAMDNGSWKPPAHSGNLLKKVIWDAIEPDAPLRSQRFAQHGGGNGDGVFIEKYSDDEMREYQRSLNPIIDDPQE